MSFLFCSNQEVCVYSALPDKTRKYLTVKVFKIRHLHLRTLPLFPLRSCKMLLMLSKYKSLGPSQKNGRSYARFIFNFTPHDCSPLITQKLQNKDTKAGILQHTLWLFKEKKTFDFWVTVWTHVHSSSSFIPVIFSSNETSWTSWGREAIFCRTVASPDAAFSRSWRALIKSSVYKTSQPTLEPGNFPADMATASEVTYLWQQQFLEYFLQVILKLFLPNTESSH